MTENVRQLEAPVVEDRHRLHEFAAFLARLDAAYPLNTVGVEPGAWPAMHAHDRAQTSRRM